MAPPAPELSLLITCYNLGASLRRAVDSCEPVRRAVPCELLIIDDGSTDDTPAVCAGVQARDPSVVVRRHAETQGLAASCNEGLRMARGRKWLRVDADDELVGEGMVRAYAELQRGPCDVGLADYEVVDDRTGARTRMALEPFNLFRTIACGIVFERASVLAAGGYRPLFWEEYDLLMRLERAGAIRRHCPEVAYRYRRHGAGMTADPAARLGGWRQFVEAWGVEALADHPEREAILRSLRAPQAVSDAR